MINTGVLKSTLGISLLKLKNHKIKHKIKCLSEQFEDYGYEKHKNIRLIDLNDKKYQIPKSGFELGFENLKKEFNDIIKYKGSKYPYPKNLSKEKAIKIMKRRKSIKKLVLDDDKIWKRERQREGVESPRWLLSIYYIICFGLDVVFKNKPIDRFWFLETVARMPYFSYVAVMHMYETLGWVNLNNEIRKIHAEEEENETYHLLIMQSLGGDSLWWNRFLARHGAIVYYIVLLISYVISPQYAYLFSELLEMHAVDTYHEFIDSNENLLKNMPVTSICAKYNPEAENLYDIFMSIANDELNHASDMRLFKNYNKKEIKNQNI